MSGNEDTTRHCRHVRDVVVSVVTAVVQNDPFEHRLQIAVANCDRERRLPARPQPLSHNAEAEAVEVLAHHRNCIPGPAVRVSVEDCDALIG